MRRRQGRARRLGAAPPRALPRCSVYVRKSRARRRSLPAFGRRLARSVRRSLLLSPGLLFLQERPACSYPPSSARLRRKRRDRMIPEAGVAAAVQALAEGRRGHDVPQAALERQVECTRTQPIRNRTHSETYSTFGQRTDVNFACKSSRLRATTEHPPEIASPPQRTIDPDASNLFFTGVLVSARPPWSIPSCASSPPKTPACRDGAYRASVRICFPSLEIT